MGRPIPTCQICPLPLTGFPEFIYRRRSRAWIIRSFTPPSASAASSRKKMSHDEVNLTPLCDAGGSLQWVPDLLLGVDLRDASNPDFPAVVSGRLRRLQRTFHPDRPGGDGEISR